MLAIAAMPMLTNTLKILGFCCLAALASGRAERREAWV
jgi:hypothetical protein